MGPCYTCKKTVAFGGIKDHGFRFCSRACHSEKAGFLSSIAAVPAADIDAEVTRIRNGLCAKCGKRGNGNIDVHKCVLVWSAIFITRMNEQVFISCSRCARKEQALTTAGTLLVGWWAIPAGLVYTPFALLANVYHMIDSGTRKQQASPLLLDHVRDGLAFARSNALAFATSKR